jgi:hypothetical protein
MNPLIAKSIGINLDVIIPIHSRYDNRSSPVTTIDGHPIRLFTTKFREPVFKNSYVEGTRNSIEFQNVGTTDVIINGNWTLKQGGSKKFDGGDDVNITADRFTVYFPSDPFNGDGNNRLEICEIILSDLTVSNVKHRGIEING